MWDNINLEALLRIAILFLVVGLVTALLYRLNKSGENDWSFADMFVSITKSGRRVADRQAFTHLGAFFMSSVWGTWLAYYHELTEWFFNGYMVAWAGAYALNAFIKSKGANRNESQSFESSTTTVQTGGDSHSRRSTSSGHSDRYVQGRGMALDSGDSGAEGSSPQNDAGGSSKGP